MSDCPTCPTVQAENSRLVGGIAGTLAFIDREEDEPTMPTKRPRTGNHKGPDLITTVKAMLGSALNNY